MGNGKVKNNFNIWILLIGFVFTPFSMVPLLLKGILNNLLLIFIFSSGIYFILELSFSSSLFYSMGIILILIIFQERRLIHESFITICSKIEGNFKFSDIIHRYKKSGERADISPIIFKKNKKYRVIEYGTYGFNPEDNKKLSGFVVLSGKGELVNEKNLANEIANIFLFWRYVYFNPILGKKLKRGQKPYFEFLIKFQKRFKEEIEKRIKNEYKDISNLKDKEFVKILKELDQEVIDQYPFVIKKLEILLYIFDKIYKIFLNPSVEFYEEIYEKIEEISKISQEENQIWLKRLKTWENLYKYKKEEIEKLPDLNLKRIGAGLAGDIVNSMVLKQQIYPVGGATLVNLGIEGGKAIKKKTLRYVNDVWTRHKFGIDAIKSNIKMNNELKEIKNKYNQILSSDQSLKIRNFD